jgi:hypothetical protein
MQKSRLTSGPRYGRTYLPSAKRLCTSPTAGQSDDRPVHRLEESWVKQPECTVH